MTDPPSYPPLDWACVARARARAGARIGRQIVYRATVDSTNRLARALGRTGAADGTVVLADEQTRGRGRHGRRWVAPARAGLAVSIILRLPATFPLHTLPMTVALAASDAVGAIVGAACTLKWPNDVLVHGAKAGGILLELDEVDGAWVVVAGIGLNVNAAPELPQVTDLAQAMGRPVAREPLLIDLLAALERYLDLAASDPEQVVQRWRGRLATLGQRVRARPPAAAVPGGSPASVAEGVVEGLAVDVDDQGALLLRLDDGTVRTLRAGDVTLVPPSAT